MERSKRKWAVCTGVLLIVVGIGAFVGWYKFFREEPQPAWVTATPEMRFKYGSIGAEHTAGIPYWIFYVLPRLFPEKLPGTGGYASFGLAWEQGQELPIGFTKKVIGFPRVGNTCAVCHTASFRKSEDENPVFFVAGPNHTLNLEAFFRFLVDVARDPRFNADNLMREIDLVTDLSWLDRALYRFLIIPITKKRLLEREAQFAWIYRKDFPEWGRGRDDAMNLTKYFMVQAPMDDSIGPTDMPSVWNLRKYKPEQGMLMNLAGDSHNARSVIIDSALGLFNAPPPDNEAFLKQTDWLEDYLGNLQAPPYPFPIDAEKAAVGKPLFDRHCLTCHGGPRTGKPVPLQEIGTDPERIGTWGKRHAIATNKKVLEDTGIRREGLVEAELTGYIASFLDGIWLRAPYLHNGSVPTLRDLLSPVAERPRFFYRGYDVYDPVNGGFVTQGEKAARVGTPFDVRERSNGNQGHAYGTTLPAEEKEALVEYMKTL